jgi:transposase-like protein
MARLTLKRYSIAFKRHVVSEYDAGESVCHLKKRYGITGNGTVERWIREYGREGLRHNLMRIQHPSEQDQLKVLAARVQELESALAQVTLDKLMYEAMVKVAEEKYGLSLKKTNEPK